MQAELSKLIEQELESMEEGAPFPQQTLPRARPDRASLEMETERPQPSPSPRLLLTPRFVLCAVLCFAAGVVIVARVLTPAPVGAGLAPAAARPAALASAPTDDAQGRPGDTNTSSTSSANANATTTTTTTTT